jgi:hypothetical protein
MEIIDKELYNKVKTDASKKFMSKSGIYRSAWIVREYKKRGGRYSGQKPNNTGLKRWFKEKWIDLNDPTGIQKCGRSSYNPKRNYPLCRPSIRITSKTPKTVFEVEPKSIIKNLYIKKRIKGDGYVKW